MKLRLCGLAASALIAGAALFVTEASLAASGVVVAKSVEIKGKSVADVAKLVAGFCAIQTWHPAIAKCAEVKEGNDTFRVLTLKDGGEIKEKRTSQSETSYGYKIVGGPLPVKDYMATFAVKPQGETDVKVEWVASFQRRTARQRPTPRRRSKASSRRASRALPRRLPSKSLFAPEAVTEESPMPPPSRHFQEKIPHHTALLGAYFLCFTACSSPPCRWP